jgi:hypothetical protein
MAGVSQFELLAFSHLAGIMLRKKEAIEGGMKSQRQLDPL